MLRKEHTITLLLAMFGGMFCILIFGGIALSIMLLALIYALARTIFGEGGRDASESKRTGSLMESVTPVWPQPGDHA